MDKEQPKRISLVETKEEPFVGIYLGTLPADEGVVHRFRILGGRSCEIPGAPGFNQQMANLVKVGAVCKISYKGEVQGPDGHPQHMADVLLIL